MNRYQELLEECRAKEEKELVSDVEEEFELEDEEDVDAYVEGFAERLRGMLDHFGFELSEADATAEETFEAVDEFLVQEDLEDTEYAAIEDLLEELQSALRVRYAQELAEQELDEVKVKARVGKTPEDMEKALKAREAVPRPPSKSVLARSADYLPRTASGRVKVRVPEGAKLDKMVPRPPSELPKKKEKMIGLPGYRRKLMGKFSRAGSDYTGSRPGTLLKKVAKTVPSVAQHVAAAKEEPKVVQKAAEPGVEMKKKEGWPKGSDIIRSAIKKAKTKKGGEALAKAFGPSSASSSAASPSAASKEAKASKAARILKAVKGQPKMSSGSKAAGSKPELAKAQAELDRILGFRK